MSKLPGHGGRWHAARIHQGAENPHMSPPFAPLVNFGVPPPPWENLFDVVPGATPPAQNLKTFKPIFTHYISFGGTRK